MQMMTPAKNTSTSTTQATTTSLSTGKKKDSKGEISKNIRGGNGTQAVPVHKLSYLADHINVLKNVVSSQTPKPLKEKH